MRIIIWTMASALFLIGCQNTNSGKTSLSSDYELKPIAGSEVQMAYLKSPEGNLMETGPVRNGKKNGTWSYYSTDEEFPKQIISFVDDLYNGLYLEFNDRGQAELMATYKNNKLDGAWGKYRFGRPELTANYVDGELDGIFREYNYRNGKIKKEASYKAGKLDGLVRDYDDDGNVMVEYMYRDGEKISGGIIEQEN